MSAPLSSDARSRLALVLAILLLVLAFVFGGSSRADALTQLPVRLGALLLGAAAVYLCSWDELRVVRAPLILLGCWTLLIAVQLIPLPPEAWLALPRRDQFAELAAIAGIPQPWRPISLVPHATANSLVAMIVPLAVLVTVGRLSTRHHPTILLTVVLLAVISGILGAAQVAADGALSLYRIGNHDNATGFFANRNHQAAWMASMVPALAGMATLPREQARASAAQPLFVLAFILIFPLVFVTGSRSGLILLALGIALSMAILRKTGGLREMPVRVPKWAWGALAVAILAAIAAMIVFRVGGVERLLTQDAGQDLRISTLATVTQMATGYFPAGAGFGAFPDLFKIDEPLSRLDFQYFNRAHNDALEIVIEGGLIAVILTLAFLGWLFAASVRLWRAPVRRDRTAHILGLVGSAGLAILLSASLVDYPLRTPALAALAAVLAAFIAAGDSALSSHGKDATPALDTVPRGIV